MEGRQVRDIMIKEVTTLKRNDKLSLAEDIMQLVACNGRIGSASIHEVVPPVWLYEPSC